MGNYRYQLHFFLHYEYAQIEQHLQKMAEQGWQLDSIRNRNLWRYRREQPQRLQYEVVYHTKWTTEQQEAYQQRQIAGDWQKVDSWVGADIFCSAQENPPGMEPDQMEKLEQINRQSRSAISLLLIPFLFLMAWVDLDVSFVESLAEVLSRNITVCKLSFAVLLSLQLMADWLAYHHWYQHMRRSLSQENKVWPLPFWYQAGKMLFLILWGIQILYALAALWVDASPRVCLWFAGYVILLSMMAELLHLLLERFSVSENRIRFIQTAILLFLILGCMVWAVQHQQFFWPNEVPDDTHTQNVYHDALPLTLADLQMAEEDQYSYQYQRQCSPLLCWYQGTQQNEAADYFQIALAYEVIDTPFSFLGQACVSSWLDNSRWFVEPNGMLLCSPDSYQILRLPEQTDVIVYQLWRENQVEGYVFCGKKRQALIASQQPIQKELLPVIAEKLAVI